MRKNWKKMRQNFLLFLLWKRYVEIIFLKIEENVIRHYSTKIEEWVVERRSYISQITGIYEKRKGRMKKKEKEKGSNKGEVICAYIHGMVLITLSRVHVKSEKAMTPHSSALAWTIPGTEEPGGLQSMGSLRVRHDWATSLSHSTFMHWRRQWQPTPVLLPGESQGRGSLVGCRLWGRTETDTTEAI